MKGKRGEKIGWTQKGRGSCGERRATISVRVRCNDQIAQRAMYRVINAPTRAIKQHYFSAASSPAD